MAKHIERGKKGEFEAQRYLETSGYQILDLNWRHKRAEVDIIAKKDGILVFVEVKTRENNNYGYPEDSVSESKQRLLSEASEAYLEDREHEGEIRFDVISIILFGEDAGLHHIEDAFFPSDTI